MSVSAGMFFVCVVCVPEFVILFELWFQGVECGFESLVAILYVIYR